jgi:cell wall-active antibiotic response 4TMS protein YvqF
MTDQPTETGAGSTPNPSPDAPGAPNAAPAPGAERPPTFEERMERFGREAGEAGERFGKRAEAAANRWSHEPGVVHAADTAGRIWGLILLAVGLWFFADVTLGYDMPSIAWRDLWPIALIGIGLLVLVRGASRRRT